MKYHAAKMEEINKIIKELWQATYKGNDIDTIAVRSDVESSTGRYEFSWKSTQPLELHTTTDWSWSRETRSSM